MPCANCVETIETRDGDVACEKCAPLHSTRCVGCGQWNRNETSCPDCVVCDRCDTTIAEPQTIVTTRGSTICPQCRQQWYRRCGVCDEWNRDGADCGNGCCDPHDCQCYECRARNVGNLVYESSYKPRPVFHGAGPLFLGPEIEIETPYWREEDCAKLAASYLGDLGYLKEDSSIGSGFEIVTHPMSYEWAMANFPWEMLTELHESGCGTHDNTGLHVHVSRAGFSSAGHIYRWMVFIYRNELQVTTIARRSSDDWAAFTDQDRRAVKHYAKGERGKRGGRYRAINTNNDDTFELRVFASSLDPAEVQAALGFAAASVEYTRHLTVAAITHRGGWTWSAFVAWLANEPAYQPLTRQLEELQCVC